jgi:hypothetical protein
MLKIVELPLIKFPSFISTQHNLQMIKMMMVQNMSLLLKDQNHNISPTFLKSDYEDAWILDTGATQHMTFRQDFFWNFQPCHLNSIFLADDTKHTPYGKGVVKVYLPGIGEK